MREPKAISYLWTKHIDSTKNLWYSNKEISHNQTEDEEVKLRDGLTESPGRCDPGRCGFSIMGL